MKKLFIKIFLAFTMSLSFTYAAPYFSLATGLLNVIKNTPPTQGDDTTEQSGQFDPMFNAQNFLTGQLDFNGKLFIRGEISVDAENIFDFNNIEKNASFNVSEISATYKINAGGSSHSLSAYFGNFEGFGSDIFLRRQFGIDPIISSFTESFSSLSGVSYFPMHALGLGYAMRLESPFVWGVNVYRNMAQEGVDNVSSAWNLDLRAAAVIDLLALDIFAGLTVPVTQSETALINAEEIDFHTGVVVFLGNRNSVSALLQAGFNNLRIRKDNVEFDLPGTYAFFEARARASYISIDTAGFMLPIATARNMVYLRDVIARESWDNTVYGANVNVHSESIHIGSQGFTLGGHITFSLSPSEGTDLGSVFTAQAWDLSLSPYAKLNMFGGTLSASISLSLSAMTDPKNAWCVRLGFTTSF